MKVLVKEKLSKTGIEKMREAGLDVEIGVDWSREEMIERLPEFDALIVRSATKVDAEVIAAGTRLKVIGRAGIGVDNIDVEEATKRGIIVCNAPQSNIVSAAEHAIALLLALLRRIPQAHYSLKHERKWERSKFNGVEVTDKIMGVIGLGRVGAIVAAKARGLGMKVVGYDPYVSAEKFAQLGVERYENLHDLLKVADFLSIHLPKTKETIGILSDREFQVMKDGVYIVNTARGGLFSEATLAKYLKEGKVAGAAIDVFEQEPCTDSPLFEFDNVVVTPHLGASTVEAQDKAGYMIAEQVIAALKGDFVSAAVNIPMVPAEIMEAVKPYLPVAELLGAAAAQLVEGSFSTIEVAYQGDLAELDTRLLSVAVLKGFFSRVVEEPVSYVNAPILAQERGIELRETKSSGGTAKGNAISVSIDALTVTGTSVAPDYTPRLTGLYGYELDLAPSQYMLVIKNQDKPGIIGKLGTILGENNINIAAMQVGRKEARGMAVSVVVVDEKVNASTLEAIRGIDGVIDARLIIL